MENKINVCLLLSYDQRPAPDEEMSELVDICIRTGEVYFATTRNISSASDGAEVAFYADGQEHFSVLATAKFVRFIPIEDPESESIRLHHELYRRNSPDRLRGFVHLKGLRLAAAGMRLDDLNGWLANGWTLKSEEISPDRPEVSIYYIKNLVSDPNELGIGTDDQIRLCEAKCLELNDKYEATRQLWKKHVDRIILNHDIQLKEALSKQKRPVSGTTKKILGHLLNGGFPDIQLLRDSADVILRNYNESDSIFQCLRELQRDGRIRNSKKVQGLEKWNERRFGDNLGRLYYRHYPQESGYYYQILISQKDRQKRDIKYLRSL